MSITYGNEYIGYIDPWDEERLTDEKVVRCRDCAEWYEYDAYERTWPEITEFKLHECRRFKTRDPEGYCAWGERSGS